MNEYEKAVADYKALKPETFPFLLKILLHEQYSFDIFEMEPVLELWFYADNKIDALKHVLHVSCYGVSSTELGISSIQPLHLEIRSLHEWHWEDRYFEIQSFNDKGILQAGDFYCRRFVAKIENVEKEHN
ncbi:hypothetical protein KDA_40290 [Dictyobacter alpinus]|uniref:Uncharacterized protein n=1 Tax=Dictyobacter alpinus TaxID=2014873 RepID=A0A402BB18_9CHLR|nr:hypothetical protein [Dictyobacter alpinus]GCE28545.1 hypothetical protein KDA_40290 [Dictyobacter alpinus]